MALNTTAATVTPGQLGSAALWNVEVRDAINGIQSSWTAYTPALTSSGTQPTMGTSNTAAGTYQQIGKTILGAGEIVAGTASFAAGTGSYRISLPVATTASAVTAGRVCGTATFFDSSAGNFYVMLLTASSTTTCAMVLNASGAMGATAPVVPANNDQWRFAFQYEAA